MRIPADLAQLMLWDAIESHSAAHVEKAIALGANPLLPHPRDRETPLRKLMRLAFYVQPDLAAVACVAELLLAHGANPLQDESLVAAARSCNAAALNAMARSCIGRDCRDASGRPLFELLCSELAASDLAWALESLSKVALASTPESVLAVWSGAIALQDDPTRATAQGYQFASALRATRLLLALLPEPLAPEVALQVLQAISSMPAPASEIPEDAALVVGYLQARQLEANVSGATAVRPRM